MCGIAAFFGQNIHRPSFNEIAVAAAKRGPHGRGLVTVDVDGARFFNHEIGPGDQSDLVSLTERTRAAVYHGRLATTFGNAKSVQALQPMVIEYKGGYLAIAHNGNYRPADRIAWEEGIPWESGNDTEVIGKLMAERRGRGMDLQACLHDAIVTIPASDPYALIVVDLQSAHCVYARRGLPLFYGLIGDDLYLSSRQHGICGSELEQNRAFIYLQRHEI